MNTETVFQRTNNTFAKFSFKRSLEWNARLPTGKQIIDSHISCLKYFQFLKSF